VKNKRLSTLVGEFFFCFFLSDVTAVDAIDYAILSRLLVLSFLEHGKNLRGTNSIIIV